MEKAKEKQTAEEKCLEIINSKIYDMITPEEAKEFMKYEIDSNISIENIMGVEKALKLV
jgi:NADPH-dependent 7-cyano-7-deazaguanine reductase QueF